MNPDIETLLDRLMKVDGQIALSAADVKALVSHIRKQEEIISDLEDEVATLEDDLGQLEEELEEREAERQDAHDPGGEDSAGA